MKSVHGFPFRNYTIFVRTTCQKSGKWTAAISIQEGQMGEGATRYAANVIETEFDTEAVAKENALRLATDWIYKNPARTFKPAPDIEYLIRQRMAECDACSDVQLTGIQWHIPDETGCNWNIEWMQGNQAAVRQCGVDIGAFVQNLRRLYLISTPE